jgi:hypothetical protein
VSEETQLPVEGYLRIKNRNIGYVREMHKNFLQDTNQAIASLE